MSCLADALRWWSHLRTHWGSNYPGGSKGSRKPCPQGFRHSYLQDSMWLRLQGLWQRPSDLLKCVGVILPISFRIALWSVPEELRSLKIFLQSVPFSWFHLIQTGNVDPISIPGFYWNGCLVHEPYSLLNGCSPILFGIFKSSFLSFCSIDWLRIFQLFRFWLLYA
jgi:hypothetical protein